MTRIGALDAEPPQLRLEAPQVAAHHRHHVRVGHGGAGALELPDLGQDLRGQRQHHARRLFADDRCGCLLVGTARVRVEKRDRDRLDALAGQEADGLPDAGRVQRRQDLPARAEALDHLAPPAARDQRRRALEVDVVEPREAEAPDLEEVAEPCGREEPRPRPAPLEDGVRRDGRAVDQLAEVRGADARRRHQLARAPDDRLGVVAGGREDLPREGTPVRPDQNQIGERAPDVDSETIAHRVSPDRPPDPKRPVRRQAIVNRHEDGRDTGSASQAS